MGIVEDMRRRVAEHKADVNGRAGNTALRDGSPLA
jgi:hypothetical protein